MAKGQQGKQKGKEKTECISRDKMLSRYTVFLCGVLLSATGIGFITRAGLGTSPISGIPFVLSLITAPTMGIYTFLFNMLYLCLEAFIRRRLSWEQALQIPVAVLFSFCIDGALAVIPTRYGGAYHLSLVYLLIGCLIMAFGIALEVAADVIMLPAEALVRAIANKLHLEFGNVKIVFDSSLTAIAALIAFFAFHKLNGVREGTLVSALLVGQLVKLYGKHLKKLKTWLHAEDCVCVCKTESSL